MKKTTKILSCLLIMAIILSTVLMTGCKKEPLVIKDSEECIVIKTTEEAMGGKTDMLLIDYMKIMKEQEGLEYEVKDGMVVSINGIENPADFSSCWMLYTSDVEFSNTAWGTVEYDGKEYGSAVSGAEALKIKPNCLYIWVFQSFA